MKIEVRESGIKYAKLIPGKPRLKTYIALIKGVLFLIGGISVVVALCLHKQ